MYEELDKIKTKKQFKELMDKLNGQLRQLSIQNEESSSEEEEEDIDYDTSSLMLPRKPKLRRDSTAELSGQKSQQILWAFTKVDQMKQELWSKLEDHLFDMYRNFPTIRFIVTTSKKHKLSFNSFLNQQEFTQ